MGNIIQLKAILPSSIPICFLFSFQRMKQESDLYLLTLFFFCSLFWFFQFFSASVLSTSFFLSDQYHVHVENMSCSSFYESYQLFYSKLYLFDIFLPFLLYNIYSCLSWTFVLSTISTKNLHLCYLIQLICIPRQLTIREKLTCHINAVLLIQIYSWMCNPVLSIAWLYR